MGIALRDRANGCRSGSTESRMRYRYEDEVSDTAADFTSTELGTDENATLAVRRTHLRDRVVNMAKLRDANRFAVPSRQREQVKGVCQRTGKP